MVDYYNYKMSGSEEELESHAQPGMTKAELRRVKISLDFFFLFFFKGGWIVKRGDSVDSVTAEFFIVIFLFFWMDMFMY